MTFFRKVKSSFDHVLMYEDPQLQEKARTCIPLPQLREKAERKLKSATQNGNKADILDYLLLELLAWFKFDFFQWVDSPKCDFCGGSTRNLGMTEPSASEVMFGASRVENYQCQQCSRHTRFPRYNHPGKLLETRRGRCGEWANCFTLCCRAVGLESRYVLDWTDHVWTEVYSRSKQRWLHCDPCENACDRPLLYEVGWKKKLTYVIAFSKDDVQDVTWRYSAKHQEVLARRTQCREKWLLNVLAKFREQRQQSVSESRKQELLDRLVAEIVEFLSVKTAGTGEKVGRQTGSVEWRQARGEMGDYPQVPSTVISLNEREKETKVYVSTHCVTYSFHILVITSYAISKFCTPVIKFNQQKICSQGAVQCINTQRVLISCYRDRVIPSLIGASRPPTGSPVGLPTFFFSSATFCTFGGHLL